MTTVAEVDDFTDVEASTLVQCERVIERGLKTFVEVGTALATIRDGRLYRTEYDTFEAYCEQRWAISRPRAYQLMAAADVVSTTVDTGYRPPSNEAQARELGRAPEDQRGDVWREANERANGRPTAATVREVVRERQMPKGQEVADQIVAGIDSATRNGRGAGPVQESPATPPDVAGGSTPERPKPPKWDPEERKAHEEQVLAIKDVEAAQRYAKTLVTDVRALIFTVVQGVRQPVQGLVTADMIADVRRLITRDMIADLRRAIDLLEGEISDEG